MKTAIKVLLSVILLSYLCSIIEDEKSKRKEEQTKRENAILAAGFLVMCGGYSGTTGTNYNFVLISSNGTDWIRVYLTDKGEE